MPTTSSTQVISAIITPALLILANSSLITATAHRISSVLERVRDLTREIESAEAGSRREFLVGQLLKATVRARLIQRAMVCLYLALGAAVLTSVIVGVGSALGAAVSAVVPGLIAFAAVVLLFTASLLLVRESRIALQAVDAEMEYVQKLA